MNKVIGNTGLKMAIILLSFPVLVFCSQDSEASRKNRMLSAPKIMAPTDIVHLNNESTIEFRWTTQGDSSKRKYYLFRIYEGNMPYEDRRIIERKVGRSENSTEVEAGLFEIGKTYTWTIRQIGRREKSRNILSIFKVVD